MDKIRNLSVRKTILLYMAAALLGSFILSAVIVRIAGQTQRQVWWNYVDEEAYFEAVEKEGPDYENSILRSVGLTGKQLCRMSITEGMCHALFAALAVVILGLPISMAVCAEVSKKSFAGAVVPYQFPFLQMGLFLLVLFGMEVVLSVWMVRRQKKQSLVEQMRAQG